MCQLQPARRGLRAAAIADATHPPALQAKRDTRNPTALSPQRNVGPYRTTVRTTHTAPPAGGWLCCRAGGEPGCRLSGEDAVCILVSVYI